MKEFDITGNDQQLLIASRSGDRMAFKLLYEKYWNDLFSIAHRRLHSAEDAKDIVQEVFLSFWNNISGITIEDSLGGYLYTSLRNKIFNHFEKNNNRLQKLMNRPFTPVETEAHTFSNYCTKELQHFINQQVNAMPEKMRRIYLLSREENLSIGEIAALLSLSDQTVKNQLHNALTRLRKSLAATHSSFLGTFPLLLLFRKFL